MSTQFIYRFVETFFQLLDIAIVARILLSWFEVKSRGRLIQIIMDTTEPIFRLARQITPRTGMVDFSPLVALIGLDFIQYLLIAILNKAL
jgi:YggT family protein